MWTFATGKEITADVDKHGMGRVESGSDFARILLVLLSPQTLTAGAFIPS